MSPLCLFFLLILPVAVTGCISVSLLPQRGELQETVVQGETGPKLLLIDIEGVLSEADQGGRLGFGGRESSVARLREQLDRAREDDDVGALLLRINSPGGTVTASEILYRELLRFKRDRQVPVLAQMMGVAASGGFYLAMAADSIQAHPTTVTGSIGVLFSGVSVAGLLDKVGVEDQTVTSGPSKDATSPLRRMTPQERVQIQGIVDDLHARFREVVAAGRPELGEERIAELADGRVYSARQAQEAGLIDSVGGLPELVKEAERRLGTNRSQVVTYHRPGEWRSNLYSLAPAGPAADLRSLLGLGGPPGFFYLWRAGAGY